MAFGIQLWADRRAAAAGAAPGLAAARAAAAPGRLAEALRASMVKITH